MSMRPLVFSRTSLAARSVAITDGCVGAAVSPQRSATDWARPLMAGMKTPVAIAMPPAAKLRLVSFIDIRPPLAVFFSCIQGQ